MKNNYPIKYSVLGIYDEIDRHTNEPEQITYIASKCYVIEENTRYHENGAKMKSYEVCFPFILSNASFSFIRTNPLNSYEQVDNVYDSFDEALNAAKQKNEEYILNKIGLLPFNESFNINCEKITKKQMRILKSIKC